MPIVCPAKKYSRQVELQVLNSKCLRGNASYYEILRISRDADRNAIEKSCLELWYRFRCMRGTPLWKDISSEIELIHATLASPQARAQYDEYLASGVIARETRGGRDVPVDEGHANPPDAIPSGAGIGDGERKERWLKFRSALEFDALAAACGFNQSMDWVQPAEWSDVGSAAWLAMTFFLAGALLFWAIVHLFKRPQSLPLAAGAAKP